MKELAKAYEPGRTEERVYEAWDKSGAFEPRGEGPPFVIILPPPNITGTLHMGHALQDTLMDILVRRARMQGRPALWLPGTDHAAIATNRVLENQLRKEGTSGSEIGREAFLKRAEEWYEETGRQILDQMRRLGASCDWSRTRFTMDKEYVEAVKEAFVRHYERGHVYRGSRLVNWDPFTQTTVSDLEVDWKTQKAPFFTFQYGPFQIGTARPETKFGDKYVVMHPNDKRYEKYKHGDTLEVEWISGKVAATVIKDEAVDPEFGTGVMTITPWHDAADFTIAERHGLDKEQIIGFDGRTLPVAGEFAGMSVTEARAKVVERLKEKGLLVSVKEDYEHNIALNERGGGVIEPQVMRQWFLDMRELKGPALRAAQEKLVRFFPERFGTLFEDWLENVHDWNINRQIWLGHRLPVWWKPGTHGTDREEGNFAVSKEKPEGEWEQDPDVLDTWFSSALWPFAALGWPENTDDLKRFYPSSVLVTARDILYLWVARMVFSGLELLSDKEYGKERTEERVPFRDVYITPTVLTKDGRRMSKSLGTGVDPLELVEEYGADAVRFGLAWQTMGSQDIRFAKEHIAAGAKLANKLWNATRFVLSVSPPRLDRTPSLRELAAWARTKEDKQAVLALKKTVEAVNARLERYEFGPALHELYGFFWHEFADVYIEQSKRQLKEGDEKATKKLLLGMQANILKLFHPFVPFVTEDLWDSIPVADKTLLVAESWPS